METEKKEDTKSLTELTLEIQMMALTVSQVQPEDQEVFFEKLQNELSSNFSKKIDNYGFFQQSIFYKKIYFTLSYQADNFIDQTSLSISFWTKINSEQRTRRSSFINFFFN